MSVERTALWLDDIRRPPSPFWVWARTIDDAERVIMSHDVLEASLDHDMGLHDRDPDDENADVQRLPRQYKHYCGYVDWEKALNTPPVYCPGCLKRTMPPEWSLQPEADGTRFAEWLRDTCPLVRVPKMITIHSMNDVAAKGMFQIINEIPGVRVEIRSFERWMRE